MYPRSGWLLDSRTEDEGETTVAPTMAVGSGERERERKAKFSKASGGGAFRERFLYNIYFYIF